MDMIYFDNSATTRVDEEAAAIAMEMLRDTFGNPASLHYAGTQAYLRLTAARHQIAQLLGAPTESIVFTSGGTEANNMAVFGAVSSFRDWEGARVVTSAAEHASVLQSTAALGELGCEVVRIPLLQSGNLDLEAVAGAVTENTRLVSVMAANNETGAVFPVAEIAELVHRKNPGTLFHTDLVQGFGKMRFNISDCEADLISVSGHKIHAPKGSGALYVRDKARFRPIWYGGRQESALRPGTESVPAWCGMGAAAGRRMANMRADYESVSGLRALLLESVRGCAHIRVNSPDNALPYVVNLSVLGKKTDEMVSRLSSDNIFVSGGAACESGARSHVLKAMGLTPETVAGALRISFSAYNTPDEVARLADWLKRFDGEV